MLAVDDSGWSHVGMLVDSPKGWQVLHATPAERPNAPDAVVLDSLEFYLSPARTQAFSVYRIAEATETERKAAVQNALGFLGQPFAIIGNNGIYCTTLVWQAWLNAGVDLQVKFKHMKIPLAEGDYLLPGGILASPRLKLLEKLPPMIQLHIKD